MEILPNKIERETEMLRELARLAQPHADTSNGTLELLEVDPIKYPSQLDLHIEGNPQPPAVVESIASIAEPNFLKLVKKFNDYETNNQELSRIGQLLKGGNNVIVATNHGNLIDIALVEAAIYSSLNKLDYQFKTGIIISKMVAMLGYKLGNDSAPCADILKILCDDVFLSFPRSESIKKSRLSRLLPNEIDRHNKLMRRLVKNKLDEGGMLLAVAPSGSKDRQNEHGGYTLQALKSGTIDLIKHPKSYVLPVAIWLEGNEPMMEITNIPRLITSDEDAHQMMNGIAKKLSDKVESTDFKYNSPQNIGRTALSQ